MSCYICRKEEWRKVLKAWALQGEALHHATDNKEIAGAWFEIVGLNYDAYNNRYPNHKETPDEDDLTPPTAEELFYMNYTKKELYDALKEYMYQACDAENYHKREGYYKCQWCLDDMLRNYINEEFGED